MLLKYCQRIKKAESNAAKAVAFLDELFHLEKQFALLTPETRRKERDRLSRPVFDEFYDWVLGFSVLPNTLIGTSS